MKSLSNRLKEDDYLRFLDIRYNKIGPDLVMKFLKRMNSNKYIVGIDLRGNQGYWDNQVAKEALSLILQRNLNLNLTEKVVLKKRWVIDELLFPSLFKLGKQEKQAGDEANDEDIADLDHHSLILLDKLQRAKLYSNQVK